MSIDLGSIIRIYDKNTIKEHLNSLIDCKLVNFIFKLFLNFGSSNVKCSFLFNLNTILLFNISKLNLRLPFWDFSPKIVKG